MYKGVCPENMMKTTCSTVMSGQEPDGLIIGWKPGGPGNKDEA